MVVVRSLCADWADGLIPAKSWLQLSDSLCLGLETYIDVTFNRIPHALHLVEWAEVTYPSCLRAVRQGMVKVKLPEEE